MSDPARVDSIEAVAAFRTALCLFGDRVRAGLLEADAEIQRAAMWLRQDMAGYWSAQLEKRREALARAKLELTRKKLQKTPLGGRQSTVDEEKALAAAQRRYEEAERKRAAVHRWTRRLDEENFNYRGGVRALTQAAESDIPRALAELDRVLDRLDAYVALKPAASGPPATSAATGGMARPGEPGRPDDDPGDVPSDGGTGAPGEERT